MPRFWRLPVLSLLVGILGASAAQAQTPVYSGQTVIVGPAPIATGQTYVVPTRKFFRNERRTAMRPSYQGRQALSFASYSDRYKTEGRSPRPTDYVPVAPR